MWTPQTCESPLVLLLLDTIATPPFMYTSARVAAAVCAADSRTASRRFNTVDRPGQLTNFVFRSWQLSNREAVILLSVDRDSTWGNTHS
jgi:hypothetical protein